MIRVSELFCFDKCGILDYFLVIILFITDVFLMQLNLFHTEYMEELCIINGYVLRGKMRLPSQLQHNHLEFMDDS